MSSDPSLQLQPNPPRPAQLHAAPPEELLPDSGMATAEYAIATLAACGFAALLVAILSGGEVKAALLGIITKALSLG